MTEQVKQTKGRPRGKLKDGKTISCYIRKDIYDRLIEHCDRTGQTKTIAIERAIEQMTRNAAAMQVAGASVAEGSGVDV